MAYSGVMRTELDEELIFAIKIEDCRFLILDRISYKLDVLEIDFETHAFKDIFNGS